MEWKKHDCDVDNHNQYFKAIMPAEPLPDDFYTAGLWCDAYTRCLEFEARLIQQSHPEASPTWLVCARVLGYLIRHAPTDHGCTNISNEVMDYEDDNKLVEWLKLI